MDGIRNKFKPVYRTIAKYLLSHDRANRFENSRWLSDRKSSSIGQGPGEQLDNLASRRKSRAKLDIHCRLKLLVLVGCSIRFGR